MLTFKNTTVGGVKHRPEVSSKNIVSNCPGAGEQLPVFCFLAGMTSFIFGKLSLICEMEVALQQERSQDTGP